MKHTHYILMLPALCLCACASTLPADKTHSVTFGAAVAHNKAAQMITPSAEQKANTFIPADRARQSLARENYRKGTVQEPAPLRTTR